MICGCGLWKLTVCVRLHSRTLTPRVKSTGDLSRGLRRALETDADGWWWPTGFADRHPLALCHDCDADGDHWTRVEAYGKDRAAKRPTPVAAGAGGATARRSVACPGAGKPKATRTFTDAELTAAVISAMFTVFITKEDQSSEIPLGEMLPQEVQVDTPDKTSVELAPGAFIDLNPGEKVEFADPKHPATGFELL